MWRPGKEEAEAGRASAGPGNNSTAASPVCVSPAAPRKKRKKKEGKLSGKNISGDVHVDNLRGGKKMENVCVKIFEMKDVKKNKNTVSEFIQKEENKCNVRDEEKKCLNICKEIRL